MCLFAVCVVILCFFIVIFFFKQKTAYEMRISDWSSDVCSSDLDAYIYGYRLWEAKFYPEAEAQLKSVVEKYSSHRRASFAQNLLGRAYLDEGKPALASVAFYENYQKRPKGERAPDKIGRAHV